MATVSFSYRSKKEIANLEVRITFGKGKERFSFYTRSEIETSKAFWKEYKKGKNFRDTDKVNQKENIDEKINELEEHIISEAKRLNLKNIPDGWFKNIVHEFYYPVIEEDENKPPIELRNYFDFYLKRRSHEIPEKSRTWKKWMVIKHRLEDFEEATGREYHISEIDDDFVNEWCEHFLDVGYSEATLNKHIANIKSLCKHAKRKGVEVSLELDGLKANLNEERFIIYLTFDEINKIKDLCNLPNYLDNAKDWLIISCFTGQRVSDFMRFNPSMIKTLKGKKFINIRQFKTKFDVSIPLLPDVEAILQKRNGEFPRPISEAKYNLYIKEVCNRAGIDEPTKGKKLVNVSNENEKPKYLKEVGIYPKYELITSHTGRRSFASNFYGKIGTTFLKAITGHTSEATFLRYIGKTSNDMAIESHDLLMSVKR